MRISLIFVLKESYFCDDQLSDNVKNKPYCKLVCRLVFVFFDCVSKKRDYIYLLPAYR